MPFSGEEVVKIHKRAVAKCEAKSGWDALACMINAMKEEYKKAKEIKAEAETPTKRKASASTSQPEDQTPSASE